MGGMELAAAATLYLTFGGWLILLSMNAPAIFPRVCIRLCASEFVAAVFWAGTESATWGSVAGIWIPVAAGATGVMAVAYGVFVARGW